VARPDPWVALVARNQCGEAARGHVVRFVKYLLSLLDTGCKQPVPPSNSKIHGDRFGEGSTKCCNFGNDNNNKGRYRLQKDESPRTETARLSAVKNRQATCLGNDCGSAQEAARPLQPENPSFVFHPGPIPESSDSARTVRSELHAGLVLRVPDATFPVPAGINRSFDRRLRVSVWERCVQQHG
jgi:hypothetical protein